MAELSNEEILDAIANKNVMEICDLVSAMEEKFGVSAAAVAVASTAVAGAEAAAEEEKSEFDVVMTDFGANKINVIKTIRSITGLGLKEAKDMVEKTPATIKEGIPKEEAETVKKQLEEAGAKVDLK